MLQQDIKCLWIPKHGHNNVDQPAKTYSHQLSADTEYHLEHLLREIADRDRCEESQEVPCCQNMLMMIGEPNWL